MGLFSWKTEDKEVVEDIEAQTPGIMGRISQIGNKITQKSDEMVENYQNMQVGLLVMVTGLLFMFLSTFFIPLIPIRPSKFVCLNAFGNICIVSSLFLIRGCKHLKTYLSKDKIIFTLAYIITLLGELYFAFLHSSYFMSIMCFILNAVSLTYILFSFFKNGTTMLNYVFKNLFGCIKGLVMKMIRKDSQGTNENILGV